MDKFEYAHTFTAKWEGGLSDDKNDRGGYTHYGVSINFLIDFSSDRKNYRWLEENDFHPLPVTRTTIRNLTKYQAELIFKREFWNPLSLDDMPIQMACLLYDAAVNSGRSQSVKLAQRGYNMCVLHGVKLVEDGKLGPLTRKALINTNTRNVWEGIITARKNFYKDLVRKRPANSDFIDGWLNRANALLTYVENF